jgi:hypothetical protein
MSIFGSMGKLAMALCATLVGVLPAAPAAGRDLTWMVKGDYALTSSLHCTTSAGDAGPGSGFDPVTLERLGPGVEFSATYQGIGSYDGRGGSTFEGQVLVFEHGDAFGATQYQLSCAGAYTVAEDLVVTMDWTCSVLRLTSQPKQPPQGIPLILSGSRTTGRVLGAKRGLIMLLPDTEPNVETYTLPDWLPAPVGGAYVMDRVCGKSGTAVKIWH